jgi:hypothetical protein
MKETLNTKQRQFNAGRFATKLLLVASTVVSLSPTYVSGPALATSIDPSIARQLQDTRGQLLRRESQLLRDQDDMRKQLDDLKRRNDGNVLSGTINEIAKQLDKNYSDLRRTRSALRDVESNLL